MTLEKDCERYLAEQKATLWGRSWNVQDPRTRTLAAKWLAEQVRAVIVKRADLVAGGHRVDL